jgi:hypothetical protein
MGDGNEVSPDQILYSEEPNLTSLQQIRSVSKRATIPSYIACGYKGLEATTCSRDPRRMVRADRTLLERRSRKATDLCGDSGAVREDEFT